MNSDLVFPRILAAISSLLVSSFVTLMLSIVRGSSSSIFTMNSIFSRVLLVVVGCKMYYSDNTSMEKYGVRKGRKHNTYCSIAW